MKKMVSLIWHLCLCSPLPQSLSSLLSPSFFPIPISLCASGIVSSSIPPSLHFHSFIYSNHLLCVHCFPCSHWLCMAAVSLPATAVTDRWVCVCVCEYLHVCIQYMCAFLSMCAYLIAFTWLCVCGCLPAHACFCTIMLACINIPLIHVYVCVI